MINDTVNTYLTEGKVTLSKVIADCERAIKSSPKPEGMELSDTKIVSIIRDTFRKFGHTLDYKDAEKIANLLYEFEA